MNPEIAIIVAMDEERGIGVNGQLPWYIPEDLKRFRELTVHYPVIMGRKTLDSIIDFRKGPLPQRPNIVITRNPDYPGKGVALAGSLEEAIEIAKRFSQEKVFIIGGAQVFAQALPYANKLYLTLIEGKLGADVFFPEYQQFNKIVSEVTGESQKYRYRFQELVREL